MTAARRRTGWGPTGWCSSSARVAWGSSTWRSTPPAGRSRSRCCARTSPTTPTPAPGWPARSRPWPGCATRGWLRSSTPTPTATGPTSSPATSPGRRWTEVVADTGPLRGEALLRLGRGLSDALTRDPPGGGRPPGPQAGERPAAGRRPGGHRLRHRPRGGRHPADHDRAGHGHARLPLAGGRRGCAGHDGDRLVGLGGDAGVRRLRAAAVRPRPDGRRARPGAPRPGRPHGGRPAARARCSPRRCRRNSAGRPHADEVVAALDRYAAGAPATVVVPASRPAAEPTAAVSPTRTKVMEPYARAGPVRRLRSRATGRRARRSRTRRSARGAVRRGCPCRWTTTRGPGRRAARAGRSPTASEPDW